MLGQCKASLKAYKIVSPKTPTDTEGILKINKLAMHNFELK